MAEPDLNSPPASVLIFDGDCGFCRRWVERWKRRARHPIETIPYQDPDVARRFPQLARAGLERAVHLIEPDGSVHHGAAAVFKLLSDRASRRPLYWLYQRVPLWAGASEWAYGWTARHRSLASRIDAWLASDGGGHRVIRSQFLRGLGLIYLIAFLSLWTQILGLSGQHGIVPIQAVLGEMRQARTGWGAAFNFPTFCWFNASDMSLEIQCAAGVFFSILLLAGFVPALSTACLWALYLSLANAGTVFLEYQWDNLLLEAGLLAVFYSPLSFWVEAAAAPSRAALWLLRWLTVRLMFESGLAKILSGDPAWRHLRALQYHYETQPLPTWIGWAAHQLPAFVQAGSVLVMFAIELGFPWLVLAGRRGRIVAAAGFISLQLFIGLTGNYGFFNLLTVLLSMTLLDDDSLRRLGRPARKRLSQMGLPPRFPWRTLRWVRGPGFAVRDWMRRGWRWPKGVMALIALWALTVSLTELAASLRPNLTIPRPLWRFYRASLPLRSVNSYGLFSIMTTARKEIIIEGSDDGRSWIPYAFKYKPGELRERPRFVEPHQPRLDWQMWFAALGSYSQNPWFVNFCIRLLQGSPETLRLLAANPFPDKPPRFLRALEYDYQFTDWTERRESGRWWTRRYLGFYAPVMTLPRDWPAFQSKVRAAKTPEPRRRPSPARER